MSHTMSHHFVKLWQDLQGHRFRGSGEKRGHGNQVILSQYIIDLTGANVGATGGQCRRPCGRLRDLRDRRSVSTRPLGRPLYRRIPVWATDSECRRPCGYLRDLQGHLVVPSPQNDVMFGSMATISLSLNSCLRRRSFILPAPPPAKSTGYPPPPTPLYPYCVHTLLRIAGILWGI